MHRCCPSPERDRRRRTSPRDGQFPESRCCLVPLDPTVSRGAFRYLGAAVSWEVVLNAEWMSTPTLAVELPIGMDPAAVAQLTAQCGATRGLAILPSANGYVSVDLSAALGIEPVPGAAAVSYTTTIEIEGPPLPLTAASPMVAVQQQVIDLMLFDVSGTAIGQPCRFFTPNYVRQLAPAPSGAFPGRLGTLEVPAGAEPPGKPAPAPRRHPAPPWLAALFKWLFRRQQG